MRPSGVTVIGVIGIILGVLGLCGGLCGLAAAGMIPQLAEMAQQSGQQSPELQAMMDNSSVMRYMLVSGLIGVLLALWLLIASMMLLGMKPTGYTLMMAYAAVSILWNIVGTAIGQVVMKTPLNPLTMIGVIIGLIYPVAVLIVLTRPTIKEAFQRTF